MATVQYFSARNGDYKEISLPETSEKFISSAHDNTTNSLFLGVSLQFCTTEWLRRQIQGDERRSNGNPATPGYTPNHSDSDFRTTIRGNITAEGVRYLRASKELFEAVRSGNLRPIEVLVREILNLTQTDRYSPDVFIREYQVEALLNHALSEEEAKRLSAAGEDKYLAGQKVRSVLAAYKLRDMIVA